MSSPTLEEIQNSVNEWIKNYGVRYFDPMTNMAILTEEVGEVARIMSRLYGEQSCKKGESISNEQLADELTDVIWVAVCIANQSGCNLTKAFKKNIEKKTTRDNNRHLTNEKLA